MNEMTELGAEVEALLREWDSESAVAVVPDPSVADRCSRLPRTEIGLAERWLAHWGATWRYRPGRGWFQWDGTVWGADDGHAISRTIAAVARSVWTLEVDCVAAGDPEETAKTKDAHRRWGQACERDTVLEAALRHAARFPQVRVPEDHWDADPWTLNTLSGMVDLRTGEVHPHDPAAYCSRITACAYDPAATSADLDRVLAHLGTGSPEIPGFLRRWFGYSITGSTACQSFTYLWGAAASGKSTLVSASVAALGGSRVTSYAGTLDPGDIASSRSQDGPTPGVHRLAGRRLVAVPEAGRGYLDADLVKRLTGGEPITTRTLYGQPVEWLPQLKLTLAGNQRVGIPDDDEGIARRLLPVRIDTAVAARDRDPEVMRRLTSTVEGLEAVLAWLVAGAVEWHITGADREALDVPAFVSEELTEYRQSQDPLGEWWDEAVTEEPGQGMTTGDLHSAYVAWGKTHGVVRPLGLTAFGKRLDARGYLAVRATRSIRGIRTSGRWRDGIQVTTTF